MPTTAKERDFASQPSPHRGDEPAPSPIHSDSDTTATNTSDEFDWDEDEESKNSQTTHIKAKRGRALYVALMKLSRPVRVSLIGVLGAGLLITPLIVFLFRFKSSPARIHVHVWSLWLTIAWGAACVTYLVVDSIPRLIVSTIVLFGGQVERLKIQIEVCIDLSSLCLSYLIFFSAYFSCLCMAEIGS